MTAPSTAASRRPGVGRLLVVLLGTLAALTAVGVALLWPSGEAPRTGVVAVDVEYVTGTIVSSTVSRCGGENEDRLPDGSIPDSVPCTLVEAEVPTSAEPTGSVEVWAPSTVHPDDATPGTRVVLARYLETASEPEVWAWQDFERTVPLGALAALYAVVVVAVAGMRGVRALVGLAFAFAVIAVFVLPALLRGEDSVAVGLVGSAAIMFVVLYLAHGFSHRTSTALLGTLAGLGVTAALGVAAATAARLNGISTEETYRLAMLTGQLDGDALRGVFLAGTILAGLGVLNDVTITQASAVWELRAADPDASWRSLFRGGMRIGRDHIASTVYTIAFAYTGAALPVLLLLMVYRLPLVQTLGSGEFAEEIARTAVGSIGLVLAIPLTTLIAALVVTAGPPPARHAVPAGHVHGHSHGHVHGPGPGHAAG
ncbi:YibE/F family protein [Cellulomonas carbonis T26]|uniref:YibE/F family protein n=1 Tax=Cellulomonas carbonis T26 TaxID=947969 RepID=A0A0A0BUC2_9CELL|nr:YibE/F family protein [Cellulomonas carbonis T26]